MMDSLIFWYESNGIKNVKFRVIFWKLWSIIQSKVRSDWRYFCANVFLKTVSFGKEINFFVHDGSSIFRYESNGIKNVKFRAVFWKLWSIIQSKVRSDWRYFGANVFLKTVSFGKEIIFFVHVGFFNFSIRIQRYKERKIPGRILKVMINYSVKGQKWLKIFWCKRFP